MKLSHLGSFHAAIMDYHRLSDLLKNTNLFLTVPEAGKFKLETPTSGEGLLTMPSSHGRGQKGKWG